MPLPGESFTIMKRTVTHYLVSIALAATAALPLRAAADSGPSADVSAIRAAEVTSSQTKTSSEPLVKIANVRVIGDWAALDWTNGVSGGQCISTTRSWLPQPLLDRVW